MLCACALSRRFDKEKWAGLSVGFEGPVIFIIAQAFWPPP
jgi:hypothetical protein